MNDATAEPRQCRICGYPLDRKNRTGLCSNKTPECRRARERLASGEKPGKFRITIKAGDTFGRWTALEDYSLDNREILVRCECGLEKRLTGEMLVNGHSRSCRSCAAKFSERPPRPLYLEAGTVSGRLTVLEDVASCEDQAHCRCECGRTDITTSAVSVKFGHTRSCGCLLNDSRMKHGLTSHPLYNIWQAIVQRCTNPNNKSYCNYGGRGITICERWCDVEAFITDIEREIGPRPEGKYENGRTMYELDRADNDGGYWCGRCPDCASRGQAVINVRWSDKPTQLQNRRTVSELTRDVLRLTRERDALAAELATLKQRPAPSRRDEVDPLMEALF